MKAPWKGSPDATNTISGTSMAAPHVVSIIIIITPQGVKQSVCPSVVGTKIARSRVLGVCVCYKHNPSVDIGEKLVCTRFEFLKKAY